MSFKRYLLVEIVMILIFAFCGMFPVTFASTEYDARSAIVAAEERIVLSYQAVVEAEKAGANTTALLSALNEAGELLSRANWAYGRGDFDLALDFALRSQEELNGFVAEAEGLREAAMQERYWDFRVNVLGSIAGSLVVISGGFVFWFFSKRKFEKAGRVV